LSVDRERLQRLLGGADAARLRRRLRQRLVRGADGPITLSRATEAERTTVERLLGRPPRLGTSLRVDPDAVGDALARAGIAPDLSSALEALDGPLRDRAAEREAQAKRWQQVFDELAERAQALGLAGWLDALAASGLLKRLSGDDPDVGRRLLAASLDVLAQLPGDGINRASLAARCLGDAHALDRGQPVAALVRQALQRHWRGGAPGATDERSIWAHAGVLVGGDINSTVLVYQLPVADNGPTARMLAAQNQAAEPTYLTLRQLLRQPPRWDVAERPVYVCENPTVVAEAAERLGRDCAPIIATNGQPQAAVATLLEQLTDAGATLRCRADLDWTGIRIVNALLRRFPGTPWRMDTTTLQAYDDLPGSPLVGNPVEDEWQPDLTIALQQRGLALQEEQLLEALIADLAKEL
jgi:uncharacterized protein (TIGR02679 family)